MLFSAVKKGCPLAWIFYFFLFFSRSLRMRLCDHATAAAISSVLKNATHASSGSDRHHHHVTHAILNHADTDTHTHGRNVLLIPSQIQVQTIFPHTHAIWGMGENTGFPKPFIAYFFFPFSCEQPILLETSLHTYNEKGL